MIFPNDADGAVLKTLYENKTNFNKPHTVDFCIAIPNILSGEKISYLVEKHGFQCSVKQDDETKAWTCYCTKKIMLVYEDIIKIQNFLDEISKPFGGYSDGWGTWGGEPLEH